MTERPVIETPPPPPFGLTNLAAMRAAEKSAQEGGGEDARMDQAQLQLYYQNMFRQFQEQPMRYTGPKVPSPLGRPHPWLFRLGGVGLALAGLVFVLYGVQSWMAFPIWFIMMFNEEMTTMLNMNIVVSFIMGFVLLVALFGFIGFLKNLGSKFSIAPMIFIVLSIIGCIILSLILIQAVQAYDEYQDYDYDYYDDYYSSEYRDWDAGFYVAHVIINIFLGVTIILVSVPFLQWKHINRYPNLSTAAGVMGIISGTLIMFTFLEFLGIIHFYTGAVFLLMALALFNIPLLEKGEWPLFIAARQAEERDLRATKNPHLGLAYQMQAQAAQGYYNDPRMAGMAGYPGQGSAYHRSMGGDPYRDIIQFADNLKQG